MPWEYNQQTGNLTRNSQQVGVGYSGRGNGWNNPLMEAVQGVGPIPRGRYRIGSQHVHPGKGPVTMALSPVGHNAHGRTHFLIHGDSIQHPGDASEGCVVLPRPVREAIAASGDTDLQVVQ
jgi:hypothetical protein